MYRAEALADLLGAHPPLPVSPPPLPRLGLPPQSEIDRDLSVYEAWVEVDEALPEVAR